MSYILWMFFLEGMPLLLFCLIRRRKELMPVFRTRGRSAGFAGLLAALGYGIVVWAYSQGMIAPIAALRETSVIMAAWLGARLMHEPFGGRRIAAATAVAIGIVLLNLGRRAQVSCSSRFRPIASFRIIRVGGILVPGHPMAKGVKR